MNANFLGHFFDHHGLELIDAAVEKIPLAADDGIANFQYGLLALLNVFDELQSRLITLFDVVANVFLRRLAVQQFLVGGIKAQLRHVFVVHQHQIFFALLHEGDIRLDETSLLDVVTQPRLGIEPLDVLDSGQHRF